MFSRSSFFPYFHGRKIRAACKPESLKPKYPYVFNGLWSEKPWNPSDALSIKSLVVLRIPWCTVASQDLFQDKCKTAEDC